MVGDATDRNVTEKKRRRRGGRERGREKKGKAGERERASASVVESRGNRMRVCFVMAQ
jgi:hypothetical protein